MPSSVIRSIRNQRPVGDGGDPRDTTRTLQLEHDRSLARMGFECERGKLHCETSLGGAEGSSVKGALFSVWPGEDSSLDLSPQKFTRFEIAPSTTRFETSRKRGGRARQEHCRVGDLLRRSHGGPSDCARAPLRIALGMFLLDVVPDANP